MNRDNITSMSLSEALLRRSNSKTDWDRLRREEAADIEPESDPDEGEFDHSRGRFVMPRRKQAISVRLDPDILEFFKVAGPGYQTRMNAALRLYMNSCREASRAKESTS